MDTKRVRFYKEGGHIGLINASDLDYARHEEVDENGDPIEEKKPAVAKAAKEPKAPKATPKPKAGKKDAPAEGAK